MLPETLLKLWNCCPYLTATKVVFGRHVPFSYVSHKEGQVLAGQWMGKADNKDLQHPQGVAESVLQSEKVYALLCASFDA